MSKHIDIAQLNVKHGTYRTGSTMALKDASLLPLAKMRRRQMRQMMSALDHMQSRTKIPPGDYVIMKKIDGEFTVTVWRDDEIISLNPYGTARIGAPWHAELGAILKKKGIKSAILGGELYVHDPARRTRVQDVCHVARAPQSDADLNSLRYAVFSIFDLDGIDLSMQPVAQAAKVRELFTGGERVGPIPMVEGNEAEIQKKFDEWVVKEGGEGLVVRSEKYGWFKIKPRHSIDLAVIGFSEGTESRAGMLHSLLLALIRPDGSYHVIGRTGGGFSDAQRVQFLADLGKRLADSTYFEVNSDRVAYQMITPGLVAELSCLDVISESADGEPIERIVISYDQDAKRWDTVRRLPLASIISPQFERFRDDKTANEEDVGLSQLERIIELPEPPPAGASVALPKAEVLKRVVATKELKGKTMVRKLLMWKTNKETVANDHPAFVILATDYSPNRKTPLEREIRVSSDLAQIEAYWTEWQSTNFVKGWVVKQ